MDVFQKIMIDLYLKNQSVFVEKRHFRIEGKRVMGFYNFWVL